MTFGLHNGNYIHNHTKPKKTLMLKENQKKKLKTMAQNIKPKIQIGKLGLTPATIENIDTKLDDHELIKIKFNEYKTERIQITQQIVEQTEAEIIDKVGHTIVLYRRSRIPNRRKIKF
jgi:RNA-binding protein